MMRPLARTLAAVAVVPLLVLAGGGSVWRPAAPAGAQEAAPLRIGKVDTADHPRVTAVVTVPGGLEGVDHPPEAFELLEEGEPVDVAAERMPTTNLEVMLVFDTSGSMEGAPLDAARQAAGEFLAVLPPEVQVGVVSFGPTPTVLATPTADRGHLAAQIQSLTAAGETALYDAVTHAVDQFSPGVTDRAVVLLSDGGDTASEATLTQAIGAASDVRVNVIDLVTAESNRTALERLAAAGGGTVSSATDPAGLAELYRATASDLVNRYRMTWTSAAHGPVTLTVRLTTPAGGVLEGTTRVEMPAAPEADDRAADADADPTPTTGAPGAADSGDETFAARWGLPAGAAAVFVALVLLGIVLLPDERQARIERLRVHPGGPPARPERSVSAVTQRLVAAADAFLDRRGRRQSLATALEVADISLRAGELVVLVGAVALVVGLAGTMVAGAFGLVVGLLLVPLAAAALISRMMRQRRERFADQLPDILQLLTSTLRSGYGLLQGLDTLAREAPEPSRAEFGRVLLEVRVGRDPSEALHAMAARMASEDFGWVVGAVEINRDVGGDLATVLDNVAATIRERQRLFRQMRALTAEGRLSAIVLTALPPVLMLAMAVLNPDYLSGLTSGFGLVLLAGGAVMLTVGWVWMQRLTRLDY